MASPAQYDFTGDGSTRIFPIGSRIISQEYLKIEVNAVEVIDTTSYDIINNSIVFRVAPADTYTIVIRVVQAIEDIPELDNLTVTQIVSDNISDVKTVAENIEGISDLANITEDVATVAGNIDEVVDVADNILDVNTVADNIQDVSTVATNIADIISAIDIKTMTAETGAEGTEVLYDNVNNILTVPRGDKGLDGTYAVDITQAEYDLLSPPNPDTLYVING